MLALVVLSAVVIVLTAAGAVVALRVAGRARRLHAEPLERSGGPYLHWVPDRRGGWRLAGEFVPEPAPRQSPHRRAARGARRRSR